MSHWAIILPTSDYFEREVMRAAGLAEPYDVNSRMETTSGDHVVRVAIGADVIGEVRTSAKAHAMLSEGAALARIVREVQDIVSRHEAQARIPVQQHRRMAAAALNRRRHLLAPIRERRGTL